MNAAQANAIPLPEILSKLGCQPQKNRGSDQLYFSLLREERTPSFHVNVPGNVWFDFGEGRGGTVVDFACAWLESRSLKHEVRDALRFLSDMQIYVQFPRVFSLKPQDEEPALQVVDVGPLRHSALLRYLSDGRRIPLDLARVYLSEVKVHNRKTGKSFHALGMKNDNGGFELRNAFFKGCAGHKDVTVLRGTGVPAPDVHVFEGTMDLLSALADQEIESFRGDMIVLHSLASLSKALPYIEHYEDYGQLYTWLDNDPAGEKATHFLRQIAGQQKNLGFCAMNETYAPCKDVNEWRCKRHGLPVAQ